MRAIVLSLAWLLVGANCAGKKSVTGSDAPRQCQPNEETLNGYMDDDGCPDELARIRITVTGADNQPVKGALILFPGSSQPIPTDQTGNAVLFELLPVPSFSIEVRSPDQLALASVNVQLKEGANHVTITTDWKPVTSSLDSMPE